MNKQKTLIFSLSAILFLALSFIAYSWNEPTTAMPSGYTAPLNTSFTAQTKTGEIGASLFRDADNPNYYINPSGDSVVSGTITSASPNRDAHVATKRYVDDLFSNVGQEVSLSNLSYVTGINPQCPADSIIIMRRWNAATCQGSTYRWGCPGTSCTTSIEWVSGGVTPSCSYYSTGYPSCAHYDGTCSAQTWSEVICAKTGEPLYDSRHTVDQCEFWNGEVVSDGTNTFCRFNSSTCPVTWTQLQNWSTTVPAHASLPDFGGYVYTGSHAWSNKPRESFSCFISNSRDYCVVGYNYGNGSETVYATITQIGCY